MSKFQKTILIVLYLCGSTSIKGASISSIAVENLANSNPKTETQAVIDFVWKGESFDYFVKFNDAGKVEVGDGSYFSVSPVDDPNDPGAGGAWAAPSAFIGWDLSSADVEVWAIVVKSSKTWNIYAIEENLRDQFIPGAVFASAAANHKGKIKDISHISVIGKASASTTNVAIPDSGSALGYIALAFTTIGIIKLRASRRSRTRDAS